MSNEGLLDDRMNVVGIDTSLPIWKPTLISALQSALMQLSISPLVSAGA